MSSEQIIAKARAKHEAGRIEEAVKLYQMVLMKEPRNLDANYLLGTAYAEAGRLEAAEKYLLKAEKLMPYSPYVKVNLGNVYMKQGGYEAAFISYLQALQIQHDIPEALQNLGAVIENLEEGSSPTAAKVCLEYGLSCVWAGRLEEALAIMVVGNHLDPDNAHLQYFMTILEKNQPDRELLEKFVRQEFDQIAPYFDAKLTGSLHYDAPTLLVQMLKDVCGESMHFPVTVDLGCGTGLAGEAFRRFSGTVTGIDISEKMLEQAAAKGVYDSLLNGDIVSELERLDKRPDLFIAADVFIYVGEMDHVFKAVASKAGSGALFVFTTESIAGESPLLQLSGRYAHSREYVSSIAGRNGLTVVETREILLRKEGEQWITGDMFCVKTP